MIATSQFTISVVNDGQDGVGIVSTIIEYAVSSSGTIPPGNALIDESGNELVSNQGDVLTDGNWSTTIPTIPEGYFLWTRTRFILSNGTFDMVYAVAYQGEEGLQGVSVVSEQRQYRLSDSSTELTGSGVGYSWQTEKPTVGSGQYIWERVATTLSNNNIIYSDAVCDVVTSGLVFDVDRNSNAITSKVWESDITTKINEYDGSTGKSIRDRVTKTETDISGINTTISDIQTDVAGKADGSTVTTLTTKVNTISDTVDGHTQTIESNTSRIDDAEDEIESTKTIASQTADKFTWLVKDGTSASNFTLTSRVAELISPEVVIKDPAGSATIISGGKIHANAITTAMLATDAIKSTNYTASPNASSPYSATGTYLNLTNGNFYTPNFGIDNVHGEAYLNGEIIATSGSIGSNSTNYWEIGNVQDYNMTDSAVIRGHGTAYIQSGYWQLSNDKLNTQYYDSSQSSGVLTYYNNSGTYYDVGQKIPTNFAAYNVNDTPVVKWNKAWFYGRKYTGDSVPSFDSDWTYFFEVDSNGNVTTAGDIYEGGVKLSEKYAAITDIGSAYLPKTGGTITGNLTVNGAFSTNVMLQTNLASTSAGQLTGNANATVTHGVTGTLGVGNGGTGVNTFTSGAALIGNGSGAIQTRAIKNNLGNSALGWVSNDASTELVNVNTIAYWNGAYRGTTSNLEYVKLGKLGTVVTHDVEDFITSDGGIVDGSLQVTDLQAGNLIVTGAGRFTNGLYGDLTGNISGSSTKVKDSGDSADTTFAYSKAGVTSPSWLAAWDGYELRKISPANVLSTIGALPLAGGTLTGAVNLANNVWNKIGDDVQIGDINKAGMLGIQGVNGNTGIFFTTYKQTSKTTGGSIVWDGTKFTITGTVATSISGNAATATTANSAGKWTNGITLTVGGTGKTIDGSADVSFGKSEISGVAQPASTDTGVTSNAGWMSGADKYKLDSITVTSGGAIATKNITVERGLQDASTVEGVYQLGHSNSIAAGTVSGTSNSGNVAFGSTVTIPKITYDAYGHITAATTTTFKLPAAPTTVTGNAGTATQFASAQSVTLTGDTTGTASSQAGWSIATRTTKLSGINASGAAQSGTTSRPTTANTQYADTGLRYYLATSSMGTGKPGADAHIIHMPWDTGAWDVQIALCHGPYLQIRSETGTANTWGNWITVLDANNYTSYTVTKTGTGASGTWGISISGTAGSATKATQDSDGNAINTTYAKLSGATFTGAVTGTYYLATAKMTLAGGKMSEISTNPRGGLFADGIAMSNPATRDDEGWIRMLGTGESDSVLEIATGDDASEQIKVRQYNTSSAIIHESTLLDASGNTALSGRLTLGSGTSAAANTCQLYMNTATQSLDFIFN